MRQVVGIRVTGDGKSGVTYDPGPTTSPSPSGHLDLAWASSGFFGPSRLYRRSPAQAIIAALSVVYARSGSRTGTSTS